MSAADRLAAGYQPDFDIDYALGRQGEDFITDIIDQLRSSSIEVKTDARYGDTGNVYIEYECKRRGQYVPSGIATTKAVLWAFVLPGDCVYVAPTANISEVALRYWRQNPDSRKECKVGSHPTRGVAIPLRRLIDDLKAYESKLHTWPWKTPMNADEQARFDAIEVPKTTPEASCPCQRCYQIRVDSWGA